MAKITADGESSWNTTLAQQNSGLRFSTTASGVTAERLRIASAGQIGIGGANYGTSGQVLTSGGASAAPSWATNPVAFRNRIINGDMRIWQRGTTISNPTTSNFYTADRWGVNRNSDVSGATVSRDISGLSGFEYCLKLQRTAGNTNTASLSLFYSNESTNTYDLAGSPATLSFWAKIGANYSGGALNVVVYSGTGTDQRVYAYTGLASFASANQAITSTWTRYTFTGTVAANATETGLILTWTPTGTAGADDSLYITGVQLEAGSTATDFERRPIGTELALCQRYYQKTYELGTAPATVTTVGAINYIATGAYQDLNDRLMVEMRGIPSTVRIFNPATGTAGEVRNYSNSTNYAATINSGAGQTSSKQTMFRTSVPATSANELTYHLTVDAEL
jgi:hypothetical protein